MNQETRKLVLEREGMSDPADEIAKQSNLGLIVQEPKYPSDHMVELYSCVEKLENKQLQIPEFQRKFVWGKQQIVGWITSIMEQNAIGVIVTYQLPDGGPLFLADGLQRITATAKFIEHPEKYGYDFGTKQAKQHCENFTIPVQHRLYKSHREALRAFQYLNMGTALSPREFHAGLLRLFGTTGRLADREIIVAVEKTMASYIPMRNQNRKQKQNLERDSLGLFYQYASKSKNKGFWAPNTTKLHHNGPLIEQLLVDYIAGKTTAELKKEIHQFEKFLHGQLAQLAKYSESGRAFSPPCLHAIAHACIYRKNAGIPAKKFWSLIEMIFEQWQPQKSYSTRMVLPSKNSKDPPFDTTIQVHSVNWLDKSAEHFGFDLYNGRKNSGGARPGYEISHKDPVATHGEGPTIIEPAPSNRIRGAKSITE